MSPDIARREPQKVEQTRDRRYVQPAVDIYENRDEYLLIADIPGVSKDNLHIHIDSERILLEARAKEASNLSALSRELPPLDYRRSFQVSDSIDREKVSADLQGGVLRLHLPKLAALKPRQIEVRAG
jgi:HSP20 family molecular chaperone IbpA